MPDLEIYVYNAPKVAPDTSKGKKKGGYLQTGVKEYWVIDPENFECIGYRNNNGKWEIISETTRTFKIEILQLEI